MAILGGWNVWKGTAFQRGSNAMEPNESDCQAFGPQSTHIGFIGLGTMGKPMAMNLVHAGYSLMVGDLKEDAVKEVVAAGAQAGSNKEICSFADVLILMLPAGPIVQSVLFGTKAAGGSISHSCAAARLHPGAMVCDMSSVKPSESRACRDLLAQEGVSFMDAPVSGGEKGAIEGKLAIMCGGKEADFEKMQPIFQVLGSSAVRIGDCGAGSVCKLTNQMIVADTTAAICEAFIFAVKAGADPECVYQAIRGGAAGSVVLDMKLPQMLAHDFTPPSAAAAILHKDVANCLDAAHEVASPVPYTAQTFEILQSMKAEGMLDEDFAAMIRHFEQLGNCRL